MCERASNAGICNPDAPWKVGGRVIHNAEDGFMAGTGGMESLEDIIAYSHNVGAAEIGMATGPAAMYRTIRRLALPHCSLRHSLSQLPIAPVQP